MNAIRTVEVIRLTTKNIIMFLIFMRLFYIEHNIMCEVIKAVFCNFEHLVDM